MKTTLELPDDLMREIKLRAVHEDRKLKDLVAELLRKGLDAPAEGPRKVRHRVKLPIIECSRPASPDEELTPERVAQILNDEEVQWTLDSWR